jgi:hypothetical protein
MEVPPHDVVCVQRFPVRLAEDKPVVMIVGVEHLALLGLRCLELLHLGRQVVTRPAARPEREKRSCTFL